MVGLLYYQPLEKLLKHPSMSLIFEKTILICGGAGFIGSNFIQYFYNKYPEYRLVNLDALTYSGNRQNLVSIESKEMIRPLVERRYHFVQGDICDSQTLILRLNLMLIVPFALLMILFGLILTEFTISLKQVAGTVCLVLYKFPLMKCMVMCL